MRILLVEDDPDLSRQLRTALADAGYAVDHAPDGEEAQFLGETEPYDAVVLDLGLPKVDGVSVLERWRRGGVATPVLILTARGAWSEKVAGFDAGADDYLTKPFDFDELLARVEALARRGRGFDAGPPPRVVIGEVSLDRDAMEIRKSGRVVELTAKEYQLLDLLMSAPGKVMSRTRILNKVWGYDSDPLTNVVDVYIRRIRAKLELDPEAGLIRTVRGYGYKIDAGD